ncbi:ferredoxin family protein [candidate division TA06 bacterium]|nr:ferredoxin family protein [candidate division TA06 bacterium]
MSHIITEPCIGVKDATCVQVCPVDCIHEAENQFYIDPEECIDCGVCIPECPVDAIFTEEEVPDKWQKFIQINTELTNKNK